MFMFRAITHPFVIFSFFTDAAVSHAHRHTEFKCTASPDPTVISANDEENKRGRFSSGGRRSKTKKKIEKCQLIQPETSVDEFRSVSFCLSFKRGLENTQKYYQNKKKKSHAQASKYNEAI